MSKGSESLFAADVQTLADVGMMSGEVEALNRVLARLRKMETTLRAIQGWDCLNPPDPSLCADHPWRTTPPCCCPKCGVILIACRCGWGITG